MITKAKEDPYGGLTLAPSASLRMKVALKEARAILLQEDCLFDNNDMRRQAQVAVAVKLFDFVGEYAPRSTD